MRPATHSLDPAIADLYAALARDPFHFDFFHALRRIEALHPHKPRIGRAARPVDEPVRFGQEPSLSFAPTTLASFQRPDANSARARLEVRFFGLLGPNGPLPLHLTEYARERLIHAQDGTFARFLDIFHHRFISLFYRAWAQAQPTESLDRPRDDRFSSYVGAQLGLGTPALRNRDAVHDHAKLFHSGLLSRHVRNADGLAAILTGFFRVSVRVEQFVGHWLALPASDRTRMGMAATACLGRGAMMGGQVWDRQHKFRLRLGPLTLLQYESFLPGGNAIGQIVAWVRLYLSFEMDWDMRLVLLKAEVPQVRLRQYGRLGWTTWLGKKVRSHDVDDLKLSPEHLASFKGTPAAALGAP
jgi:type VI secretion system protein ImpH